MVVIQKAMVKDAKKLLQIQKEAFQLYFQKYGDFDSNPYYMTLHRMEFNIKYRFGQYYKVIDEKTLEVIGGIFAFELDQKDVMKIAQFYLGKPYQSLGYGKIILQYLIDQNPHVKKWYVDTIFQEEYNMEFYQHVGFEIIDQEEEHEGLTFVTLLKTII